MMIMVVMITRITLTVHPQRDRQPQTESVEPKWQAVAKDGVDKIKLLIQVGRDPKAKSNARASTHTLIARTGGKYSVYY